MLRAIKTKALPCNHLSAEIQVVNVYYAIPVVSQLHWVLFSRDLPSPSTTRLVLGTSSLRESLN